MEILKIKKSLREILKLFRMMEHKQIGIIKETVDEFANGDEDNLKCLKYCVYFTDRSGMLKQYLLDLGVQCILKPPRACIKNDLLFCNVAPSVQKL